MSSVFAGAVRGMLGMPVALCLSNNVGPFHSQELWGVLFLPLEPWAAGLGIGPLAAQRGPPQPRYLSWFLTPHGVGSLPIARLHPPAILNLASSVCLCNRTSVQLDLAGSRRCSLCSFVLMLLWSWEEASTASAGSAIDQKPPRRPFSGCAAVRCKRFRN